MKRLCLFLACVLFPAVAFAADPVQPVGWLDWLSSLLGDSKSTLAVLAVVIGPRIVRWYLAGATGGLSGLLAVIVGAIPSLKTEAVKPIADNVARIKIDGKVDPAEVEAAFRLLMVAIQLSEDAKKPIVVEALKKLTPKELTEVK